MRRRTVAVRGHGHVDELGALIPPIYQSAVFQQIGEARKSDRGTDLKYSREENPTVRAFERAMAGLEEGADALGFNSGMAAIATVVLASAGRGARLLTTMELYGATLRLFGNLSKFGIEVHRAFPDTEAVVEGIKAVKPDLVFLETMTNPTLRVLDVPAAVKAARDVGALVVVDNTFVTPVLFTPLAHGAHVVVHSATKYISGHNDLVAGVAAVAEEGLAGELWLWRAMLGGIMQPFEAFLALRGLKTLPLRFEAQCDSAMKVAEFLADHSKVKEVLYPGLPSHPHHGVASKLFDGRYGAVVSFRVRGGMAEVVRFLKSLRVIFPSPSLGGTESIATYPIVSAAMPIPEEDRRALGITEDLIRLSVGLEDPEDIVEDLDRALSQIP